MNLQAPHVSVVEPVGQALDYTRQILFRPFDLGKWFVIGFCAWLAGLGEMGGGGGGGDWTERSRVGGGGLDFGQVVEQARQYVSANLYWLLPLVVVIAILVLAIWLALIWLSSRGRFMFLHCVAQNRAEVQWPWRQYRPHGNSLFRFRIVVGLIGLGLILPLLAVLGYVVVQAVGAHRGLGQVFALLLLLGGLVLALALGLFLIAKLTTDFVVPIMFVRGFACSAAWREFLRLLGGHLVHFILYLLFQMVLWTAIFFLVLAVVLVTCCVACCFLIIPYLGTVLVLPVLVFGRAYSACYLRQFDPDYDLFAPAA